MSFQKYSILLLKRLKQLVKYVKRVELWDEYVGKCVNFVVLGHTHHGRVDNFSSHLNTSNPTL